MLILRYYLITEVTPLMDPMFNVIGIHHEIVQEHYRMVTAATTVQFFGVMTDPTDPNPNTSMNFLH